MAESVDGKFVVWGDSRGVVRVLRLAEKGIVELRGDRGEGRRRCGVLDILCGHGGRVRWLAADGMLRVRSMPRKRDDGAVKVNEVEGLLTSEAKATCDGVVVVVWTKARWPWQRKQGLLRLRFAGEERKRVASLPVFPRQRGANELIGHLALSPDGRLLAAVADGDVAVLDVASMKILRRFGRGWGEAAAFSPSSKRLAVGTDGRGVLVWDVATGRLVKEVPLHRASDGSILAFQSENSLYAGSGPRSELYYIELETGRAVVFGRFAGMCKILVSKSKGRVLLGLRTGDIVSCIARSEPK